MLTASPAPQMSRSATDLGARIPLDQAARVAAAMGLLPHEFAAIQAALARDISHAELAVFSGMWSEHCSYKSTRHLLAALPKEGDAVLAGPGHHAGVVSVGEGWAVAFKIESHNHPSAVEPYQGAATGVGGILRDIIAQGARPCALLDFLCFADRDHADSARIERGVVAGIAGYGNAIGIPNVGGRTLYDPDYAGNPLVNALAAGLVRPQAQRSARAQGCGNTLLLVGAPTGRDGILGAAFASDVLGSREEHRSRRSHIQVGDPFAGKLLMDALLSLPADCTPVAVQDLGACGIACAAFEMASLGGVGIDVDLDAVPLREAPMTALEILLSESQERFAIVVTPDAQARTIAHFVERGVGAAAIGTLTDSGRVRVLHAGCLHVDLPAALVAGGAPQSRFSVADASPKGAPVPAAGQGQHEPIVDTLCALLQQMPDPIAIHSQFDQTVGNRTVIGPGVAAAAVLRLPDSTRGFALTLTGRGDLCAADPYIGAQAALAEAVRRLACVGARLLAITDGLNFASPRDPIEYRRIADVIAGLADGLRVLGVPATGGNVSLYNQSPRGAIPPTPMIGGLGIVPDVTRVPRQALRSGQVLLLLGALSDQPCASLYTRRRFGPAVGTPHCDLPAEQRLAALLCALVQAGLVDGLRPVSAGGGLTAVAKWCARSDVGAQVRWPVCERPHFQLFGEYPAQTLVAAQPAQVTAITHLAQTHGVPCHSLGTVVGSTLHIDGHGALPVSALQRAHVSPAVAAA